MKQQPPQILRPEGSYLSPNAVLTLGIVRTQAQRSEEIIRSDLIAGMTENIVCGNPSRGTSRRYGGEMPDEECGD